MTVTLVVSDKHYEIEVQTLSALNAIRDLGIEFMAPCGGKGTCGKCQVLVRDETGLHRKLACRTALVEGMEVYLESLQRSMIVQSEGTSAEDGCMFSVPIEKRPGYGLAVDVGTTTIVCRLHDLQTGCLLATLGNVNPQVVYGSDVIARISASMEGHLDAMCDVVRSMLDEAAQSLCHEIGIDRAEIVDIVIVGNTVIEHIAARFSPDSIGVAPFEPLSYFGEEVMFEPVGKNAYFAPVVSGYVGGDITAGITASGLHEAEHTHVYLDLGTNGELAIGSKDRITCCATAAGPVFEGATIHFGMTAQKGAISSVAFDGKKLKPVIIGEGEPIGICGTGLIETVAFLLDHGIVDETGRMLDPDELDSFWSPYVELHEGGNIFFLDEQRNVYLTQADVRNLQLAKAAICAGILTLLDDYEMKGSDVEGLIIAGGFGSFLNPEAAARIGLFPQELLPKAMSVGNMAVEGASQLLVSQQARQTANAIAQTCGYIELSTSSRFSTHYIECMMF